MMFPQSQIAVRSMFLAARLEALLGDNQTGDDQNVSALGAGGIHMVRRSNCRSATSPGERDCR